MAKSMQIQDAAGELLTAFNFGVVALGQLSAQTPIRVANTGDEPLTGVKAWKEESTADGELRVVIADIVVIGTDLASATELPDIPVGGWLEGYAQATGPEVAVDRATLQVVAD